MDNIISTLSIYISIFTAIISIAYPLYLENINKVDVTYHSTRLTARMRRQSQYKWFKVLIVFSMIETFVIPLITLFYGISCVKFTLSLLIFQALTTFALMVSMLSLINIINLYSDPYSLFLYLKDRKGDADRLGYMLDICKNIIFRDNYQQMGSIVHYLYEPIEEEQQKSSDVHLEYSTEILGLINSIFHEASVSPQGSYFHEVNEITPLLYNDLADFHVSEQVYSAVWRGLLEIIRSDNFHWFQQYWIYTYQFYNNRYTLQKSNEEDLERFKFEQFMVGTMLLYHEKYDWLNYMLYTSNDFPPHYYVLPNSMEEIWTCIKKVGSLLGGFFFESKYPMLNNDYGVRNDDIISGFAQEYIAVLVVRLYTVQDYNYGYRNPLDLPIIDEAKDSTLRRYQSYVDAVIVKFDQLLKAGTFGKIFKDRLKEDQIDKARNLLTSFRNDNFSQSAEIQKENEQEGLETLKKLLNEKYDELKTIELPWEDKLEANHYVFISSACGFGDNLALEGSYVSEFLADGLISLLKRKIDVSYSKIINKASIDKLYKIRFVDLKEALSKLQISDDFVILTSGVIGDLKVYGVEDSYHVESRENKIFIISRTLAPKITLNCKHSAPAEYTQLNDNLYLKEDKVKKQVSAGLNLGFIKPNKPINMVVIDIILTEYVDKLDLDKIKPIQEA